MVWGQREEGTLCHAFITEFRLAEFRIRVETEGGLQNLRNLILVFPLVTQL